MMKGTHIISYNQLLESLQECESSGTGEQVRVEFCFQCCHRYWNQIKLPVMNYDFEKEAEEIHFFKKAKPAFTGIAENYRLRYQAILCIKHCDLTRQVAYWKEQLEKMSRFFAIQKDFCQYLVSGSTGEDRRFFQRSSNRGREKCSARYMAWMMGCAV